MPAHDRGAIDHSTFRGLRRFPALDGLRTVAITLVILEHSHNDTIRRVSGGFDGVMLFFVLSGFLITSLLLREEARYGSVQLRAFAVRRAFRILPLFYAVLAAYVVLILVLKMDDPTGFADVIPYYAGFFQEHVRFGPHPATVPYFPFEVSWSLGIEEKFYLIWPLLAFGLLAKKRVNWRVPAALALAVVSVTAPLWLGAEHGQYLFFYANILCGCVVGILLHRESGYERLSWLGTRVGLPIAILVAVGAHGLTYTGHSGSVTTVPVALTFVAFSVLLAGLVTSEPRRAQRFLDHPLMVRIGSASYATYLTHLIVLAAAEKVFDPSTLVGGIASISLTYVAATTVAIVINETFEKPVTEYGRRAAARWFPRPAPIAEAPPGNPTVEPTPASTA